MKNFAFSKENRVGWNGGVLPNKETLISTPMFVTTFFYFREEIRLDILAFQ